MKKTITISLVGLYLTIVDASSSRISIETPLARRAQDERVKSNDEIDYLSFQKYNCDGMFIDWTGPSAFTTTLSAKVVEYDYDTYLEADSDKATALASIQSRLLKFVGGELFGDCTRRPSEGLAIQEINTSPGDQASSSTLCAVEVEFRASTQCMAVHGAMTVYYSPSNDMKSDEATIDSTVKAAIKRGMDTNVAVTDTTRAVYYIGDRDSLHYSNSKKMMNNSEQSFWQKNGALIIALAIGFILGALVILLISFCCKRRSSRSLKGQDLYLKRQDLTLNGQDLTLKGQNLTTFRNDIEIGHELATQKSFKTTRSKKSTITKSEKTQKTPERELEEYADDSATQKYDFDTWCCK